MLMKTQVIYQQSPASQDDHPREVSGQFLARNRLSARDRARLAADIIGGQVTIRNLTYRQTARLCRVSEPYIAAVRRPPPSACDLLVQHWDAATGAERIEFARRVGVDRIFDTAIAPVIG
jgi:hypothetical protein